MFFESDDPPSLPNHWIGVQADWAEHSDDPLQSLISLPPPVLVTHALVLGATGSGKTTMLHHLIAQDIEARHSFCIIDLRGDLIEAALALCAAGKIDPKLVRIIDLREKERICGFNPLFGSGEPYFRALNVLDAVAAEADSWGIQLAETLRNGLLLLAETGEPLTSLEAVFFDRTLRLSLMDRSTFQPVIDFWQRFDAMSPDRQATLAMPVLNKVSLLLATSTLRNVLGHPEPFDLGEHLNTPGSILLVSLAVDELHAASRMMGSLVLACVCREIFARVHIPEANRNPVRLYVDEFEHFGSDIFETILAEGRRFRLSAVLAHQTLAQLSPKMRSLILGNVGVKVVFRCGRDDTATLARDIYGQPGAFEFTALPVGHAIVWQRALGAVEVEMNEPLIRSGTPSRAAEDFRDEVYEESAIDAADFEQPLPGPRETESETILPRTSTLEDWLCD